MELCAYDYTAPLSFPVVDFSSCRFVAVIVSSSLGHCRFSFLIAVFYMSFLSITTRRGTLRVIFCTSIHPYLRQRISIFEQRNLYA